MDLTGIHTPEKVGENKISSVEFSQRRSWRILWAGGEVSCWWGRGEDSPLDKGGLRGQRVLVSQQRSSLPFSEERPWDVRRALAAREAMYTGRFVAACCV